MKFKPLYILLFSLVFISAIAAAAYFLIKPTNEKLPTIQYPYAIGSVTEIQAAIIEKYNLDIENGIDISFLPLNPGDIERTFIERRVPIANISPIVASELNLQGKPVRILHPEIHIVYYIGVRKNSSIQTLQDLKGKKLAILPKVTAAYTSTAVILQSAGINPDTDLNLVFTNIPDAVELLKRGDVDAAIVAYSPLAGLQATGQFRLVAKLEDIWMKKENGLSHPFVVGAAFEDWLKNEANKKIADKLSKTLFAAVKLMQQRPEVITEDSNETLKTLYQANKLDSEPAKKLIREHTAEFLYDRWTGSEIDAINRTIQRAKQFGILPPNAPENIIIRPEELNK